MGVQPKVLIDDLLRATKELEHNSGELTPDLFADFNGILGLELVKNDNSFWIVH
jgi:hypothetical protein